MFGAWKRLSVCWLEFLVVITQLWPSGSIERNEDMADIISLEGQVENIDGKLILRIPLEVGGDRLAPFAGRIGEIKDGCLNVVIQPWLAEFLRVSAGSLVFVDNKDGKFNITRSAANDSPQGLGAA
jgi:hypothetical protein